MTPSNGYILTMVYIETLWKNRFIFFRTTEQALTIFGRKFPNKVWHSSHMTSDILIGPNKKMVSHHLLKLFYDELHSFFTFFALNFDKKLAVE
jgi:hypothetical protein